VSRDGKTLQCSFSLVFMVGSPFIYTECGTRRSLLNTNHIAAVYVDEVDVNSKEATSFHKQFDPPNGKIYTLEILMSYGRPFHYFYTNPADRDAMYAQLMEALAPAFAIVDDAPDVPRKPKPIELDPARYTEQEVFATRDEFNRVFEQMLEKEKVKWQAQQPAPMLPISQPPRKPYTRKPRK
jgi:hypothetical protein